MVVLNAIIQTVVQPLVSGQTTSLNSLIGSQSPYTSNITLQVAGNDFYEPTQVSTGVQYNLTQNGAESRTSNVK